MVLEWAFEHRDELMEDWNLANQKKQLNKIKPLILEIYLRLKIYH
jgi:hypothetical protein